MISERGWSRKASLWSNRSMVVLVFMKSEIRSLKDFEQRRHLTYAYMKYLALERWEQGQKQGRLIKNLFKLSK